MKNPAVYLTGPECIEIRDEPTREPGPGEALIRTRRTLISTGTELTLYGGKARENTVWREMTRYPRQLGYSNVGEVMRVGEGVDASWIGRRVNTNEWHMLWGVSPVDALRVVPDGVSDEEATFCSLAEVAMNGLRRVGLVAGESVAVFGLGIIGQLAVRLCTVSGAEPVFGIERSAFRRSLAPRDVQTDGVEGLVDVVIEASGNAALIAEEPLLLRDEGRMLLLSSPREPTLFDFHDLCNRRSISIIGAHVFSTPKGEGKRYGEQFLSWLATGDLSVRELITHRFPYAQAADAYQFLAERREEAMGVVFEWS